MKFKERIKKYIDKKAMEYIEEYSACKWRFKGDRPLSEEEIKELLKKIEEAFGKETE